MLSLLSFCVFLAVTQAVAHDVVPRGPVTQLEPVPKDSIRIVALGTGSVSPSDFRMQLAGS